MKYSYANEIAANMDSLIRDLDSSDKLSGLAALQKEASRLAAPKIVLASNEDRADCVCCGKKRAGWTEAMGVCKCGTASGCNPITGCKPGCDCACSTKSARQDAFDSLIAVSEKLDQAGFEHLATATIGLANSLIVTAAKKDSKDEDEKEDKDVKSKKKDKEKDSKKSGKSKFDKLKNLKNLKKNKKSGK